MNSIYNEECIHTILHNFKLNSNQNELYSYQNDKNDKK